MKSVRPQAIGRITSTQSAAPSSPQSGSAKSNETLSDILINEFGLTSAHLKGDGTRELHYDPAKKNSLIFKYEDAKKKWADYIVADTSPLGSYLKSHVVDAEIIPVNYTDEIKAILGL